MKNIYKNSLIITIITGLIFPFLVSADLIISNIRFSNLRNSMITITWDTSEASKGTIYYGLKADDLNMQIGYSLYAYNHESVLTGISKDKTYYYKIVAENGAGRRFETFIQSFSTKGMKDYQKPTILNFDVLQATGNAAAIAWTTDEATKGSLSYNIYGSNKKSTASYNSYTTYHISYLYKLKADSRYNLQITAIDKDGNKQSTTITFNTSTSQQNGSDFKISDIQPIQLTLNRITDSTALLTWSTNYIAQSTIYYGTKSNSLKNKVVASSNPRYDHQVLLTNLTPNTTYYYKIVAEKGLYNKKAEISGHSFVTLPKQSAIVPQVAGDKIYSGQDSDYDGYPDQEEIDHKYNPNGYGRTTNEISIRLINPYSLESQKSNALKTWLKDNLGTYRVGARDWSVLVNAYAYGGYTEQAIKQAIKFGGKTVHPTIPFIKWENSKDYIDYINK